MDSNSRETLCLLAYLYIQNFKYDKAINLLKALKILYPNDTHVSRSLAYTYLKTGNYQAALQHAEASIKPDLTPALNLASNLIKSKALWALGREEAAKHTLTHLIEINTA